MSYQLVNLGEAAKFIRGITYKPNELVDNFSENSIVCMRTANVQTILKQDDLLSVPKNLVKDSNKVLIEGDILVSTANSWNLVGKCCWVPKLDYTATAGGFISILRANKSLLDQKYLYYWFNSDNIQLAARNCGRQTTNISNMDLERCLSIQIPLLPLEKQRRIAEILDKADALIQNRKKAIEKLDELLQATFIDMFGDPVRNTKNLPGRLLGEIVNFDTGKLDSNAAEENGIYPFFTCSRTPFAINSYAFDTEALLLAGNNAAGKYWVKHYIGKFNAYQRTYVITMKDDVCSYQYLRYVLEFLLEILQQISKGSSTKYLTLSILKPIVIPIPSQYDQNNFIEIYNQIEMQKQKMQEQLEVQETLFKSLQQQAFSGQL